MRIDSQTLQRDSLIDKQTRSAYLDRVATYCELERGHYEEPQYHDPSRATINLTLPWHSVTGEIADLNLKIV